MDVTYLDPDNVEWLDELIFSFSNLKLFILKKGIYRLRSSLVIERDNINIVGEEEVIILQENLDSNGIVIKNCKGVFLNNLSIVATNGRSIPLTVANSSNVHISHCRFHGGDSHFAVYFSGPEVAAGEETLTAYSNSSLCHGNKFTHNIVNSNWEGDSLTIALQRHAYVANNILRGGKVAIYMCRDTDIVQNYIYDTHSHGIIISWPSHNVNINSNVVRSTSSSAIATMNQLEHGEFHSSPYSLDISENEILDTKYSAIEIKEAENVNVKRNKISNISEFGIHILFSKQITITDNKVTDSRRAIVIDTTTDNISIENNQIISRNIDTEYGIIIEPNAKNIIIKNNQIFGNFLSNWIQSFNGEEQNQISDNKYKKWLTYAFHL